MKNISFYNVMKKGRNDLEKNNFIVNKTEDIEDEKLISSLLLPMLDDKNNNYSCRIQSFKLIFRMCLT
jgi:hypothetical protein